MCFRSNRILSPTCAALLAALTLLSFADRLPAAVTSIGAVNPIPPTNGGSFSGLFDVGTSTAASTDTRAWVMLDNGTTLQYATLIVGDDQNYVGVLNEQGNFLQGINTKLTLTGSGNANNPTVQIGKYGIGTLNIGGGTTMTLSNTVSQMSIGSQVSIGSQSVGVGYVNVTDPFTMLTVGQDLFVGQWGFGTLNVLNGALVQTVSTNTSIGISIGTNLNTYNAGTYSTSVGTVVVDGTGSILRSASNLTVGGAGVGTLTISNGGTVDVDNGNVPTITVGPLGRVNLAGGTLVGYTPLPAPSPPPNWGITVNGYLGGSGFVRGSVLFNTGSFLEANAGNLLQFNGSVSNYGAATINSGEIQFLAGFTNNAVDATHLEPGRISLENGVARFSQPLVNKGVIASTLGTNNVHGLITNQGTIVVASDTVAVFHDSVTNSGGGTVQVLPRGNALFLTNLTFTSASALLLTVGSNGSTDTSARIGVAGPVTVGGSITVSVDASIAPTLGQSFNLISAAGGLTGTFATTIVPTIPGGILEYGVTYSPTGAQLLVAPFGTFAGAPGDFNGDGIVDAADYTVWQDNFGSTTTLGADANGNHVIDQGDFDIWRIAFGAGQGGGGTGGGGLRTALDVAVPEPSTSLLAGSAILGLAIWPKRRRDRS